jgi:hypothetical protein
VLVAQVVYELAQHETHTHPPRSRQAPLWSNSNGWYVPKLQTLPSGSRAVLA